MIRLLGIKNCGIPGMEDFPYPYGDHSSSRSGMRGRGALRHQRGLFEIQWSPTGKRVVPKGETQLRQQQLRPFDAQRVASLGHPPDSEIRQSKIDSSLKGLRSGVTHSATAKAVVSCVGG